MPKNKPKKSTKSAPVEVPPKEIVRYICNHCEPIANLKGRACLACYHQHRRQALQRKRERRAVTGADGRDVANTIRLPNGSRYIKEYYADRKEWVCSLMIPLPGTEDGEKVFTATGSGSLRTEFVLDKMYRAWAGLEMVRPDKEVEEVDCSG